MHMEEAISLAMLACKLVETLLHQRQGLLCRLRLIKRSWRHPMQRLANVLGQALSCSLDPGMQPRHVGAGPRLVGRYGGGLPRVAPGLLPLGQLLDKLAQLRGRRVTVERALRL